MRVFAVSDIHVDYAENLQWVLQLSQQDYQQDILILAGDVSDDMALLEQVFESLQSKFMHLLFVPGNHELWVDKKEHVCSLEKFEAINSLCASRGVHTSLFESNDISFVPLLSWYDFSFGEPDRHLKRAWRDFRACSWPDNMQSSSAVAEYFHQQNIPLLETKNKTVISYSHFLPRIDVMSERIPQDRRRVYPVLGSEKLGLQVCQLNPDIHVYGHSHVNQNIEIDSIRYVNNAFAYPSESRISRKQLHCVYES
ncbi:MAG: metallophosphoesterase [SAR86 cluster bacterium]|uniref:Metallophosphoesterase n=1 Tax=SAR86 cluster bacterium TaxID=2030880 RepID=A0A2A5AWY0_9GAMM|nr:MAG: metallophosphoesterase [SAR86 cluster bacterium]